MRSSVFCRIRSWSHIRRAASSSRLWRSLLFCSCSLSKTSLAFFSVSSFRALEMASTILVDASASSMVVGLTRRYTYQSFCLISSCSPSQCSWHRAKSGGGRFRGASSSNDLTIGGVTAFPSRRNSPNSSASSLCSMDSLSSLPDEGHLRAGDPFSGRSDSAEPRAADICPFAFPEPSTWLTDLSEVKGIRPVTVLSESSCTLEGVCAVLDSPTYAVRGTSSLSVLMPNLVAATPFFLSDVLLVDAIRPLIFFQRIQRLSKETRFPFSDLSVSRRRLAFLSTINQSLEGE